jgi:hypothetical protein
MRLFVLTLTLLLFNHAQAAEGTSERNSLNQRVLEEAAQSIEAAQKACDATRNNRYKNTYIPAPADGWQEAVFDLVVSEQNEYASSCSIQSTQPSASFANSGFNSLFKELSHATSFPECLEKRKGPLDLSKTETSDYCQCLNNIPPSEKLHSHSTDTFEDLRIEVNEQRNTLIQNSKPALLSSWLDGYKQNIAERFTMMNRTFYHSQMIPPQRCDPFRMFTALKSRIEDTNPEIGDFCRDRTQCKQGISIIEKLLKEKITGDHVAVDGYMEKLISFNQNQFRSQEVFREGQFTYASCVPNQPTLHFATFLPIGSSFEEQNQSKEYNLTRANSAREVFAQALSEIGDCSNAIKFESFAKKHNNPFEMSSLQTATLQMGRLDPSIETIFYLNLDSDEETSRDKMKAKCKMMKNQIKEMDQFFAEVIKLNQRNMLEENEIKQGLNTLENLQKNLVNSLLLDQGSNKAIDTLKNDYLKTLDKQCEEAQRDLMIASCSDGDIFNTEDSLNQGIIRLINPNHETSLCGMNPQDSRCLKQDTLLCLRATKTHRSKPLTGPKLSKLVQYGEHAKAEKAEERRAIKLLCRDFANFLSFSSGPCPQGEDLEKCLQEKVMNNPENHSKYINQYAQHLRKNPLSPNAPLAALFENSTSEQAVGMKGIQEIVRKQTSYYQSKKDGWKQVHSYIASGKMASTSPTGKTIKKAEVSSWNANTNYTSQRSLPTSTEAATQQIRATDQQIQQVENKIQNVQQQMTQSSSSTEQDDLKNQLADLKDQLKKLKDQKQQLAQVKEELEEETTPRNRNRRNINRAIASEISDDDNDRTSFAANSSRSYGSGAMGGQGMGSSGFSNNFSINNPSMNSVAGASIKEIQQAGESASQLRLTVSGEKIPVQNVVSIEVKDTSDQQKLQEAILANKDKLKFDEEGFAMVEIIDQRTKKIQYLKVKLDSNKVVFKNFSRNENNQITQQVRQMRASLDKLRLRLKEARSPAND